MYSLIECIGAVNEKIGKYYRIETLRYNKNYCLVGLSGRRFKTPEEYAYLGDGEPSIGYVDRENGKFEWWSYLEDWLLILDRIKASGTLLIFDVTPFLNKEDAAFLRKAHELLNEPDYKEKQEKWLEEWENMD